MPHILLLALLQGAIPQVVATAPAHGSALVPAGEMEIRVEFDCDMAPSFSFMGGGATFPEVVGQPRWETPRICVLPVRTEPRSVYCLGLNGPSNYGFQSKVGQPSAPKPLWFRTAAKGEHAAFTDQEAQRAFQELSRLVRERYSHRERLGIDWTARLDRFEEQLRAARHPFTFGCAAAELLAVAEDPHLFLRWEGMVLPGFLHAPPPSHNIRAVGARLRDLKQHSNNVLSGLLADDVGYLCIATWERGQEASIRPAFAALEAMRELPFLVLDVRPNGGGDEMLALEFAARFVDRPKVYAKRRSLEPVADGEAWQFGEAIEAVLEPAPEESRYLGTVVLLQGPAVLSSCEAFVLMMRQASRCTTLGMPTGGSSGNPKPYPLADELTLHLPSWVAMDAADRPFEGLGIPPDLLVEPSADSFRSGDPILSAALKEIDRRR